MGVAQLVQTPSGVPTTAPQRTLPAAELKRRGVARFAIRVMRAAPKGSAKYMPKRLV